jgi:hypothetical protein
MGCSPSGASFPGSADSTSGSSGPVCELCGNASRTSSAAGSSRSIGRGSRAIPTCAPLWPTPESSDATGGRVSGTPGGKRPSGAKRAVTLATAVAHAGTRCPCRCHTSTSSAAASPARTSPSPEGRPGSTGGARVFGASTFDSLTFFDRATSSWRTFATSLLATAADGSEEFSGTWPRAGMTRNGTASRLAPLAPLTGGTASGLLPTPSAVSGTIGAARRAGRGRCARACRRWPPRTCGHVGAGDAADADRESPGRPAAHGVNVVSGSLNPAWVEWLMGFPTGWTDLEPSETPSSPRSPSGSAAASSPTKKKRARPKRPGSPDAMCVCGHPRSAHHGTGPCLVAVSGITGKDLDVRAKGSPSAPTNSVCACSAYAPKP